MKAGMIFARKATWRSRRDFGDRVCLAWPVAAFPLV
jgi:hypothetical protein